VTDVPAYPLPPPALPGIALLPVEGDDPDLVPSRWLGRIGHAEALALQEQIVRAHRQLGDVLLLLEHDPVYTTGRGGRAENLGRVGERGNPREPQLVRIGRGGDVTYHGPGQLVGYALVDLRARGGDLHRFLRDLESGVISTLAALGVTACRWPGRTGVWVADAGVSSETMDDEDMLRGTARKIASIGIAVRGGVSMHGFALNVALDLAPFAAIVPCGLAGVRMTTIERESGVVPPSLRSVAALAARHVGAALARPMARTAQGGTGRAAGTVPA
jgi:lipoate-protein ligase B